MRNLQTEVHAHAKPHEERVSRLTSAIRARRQQRGPAKPDPDLKSEFLPAYKLVLAAWMNVRVVRVPIRDGIREKRKVLLEII